MYVIRFSRPKEDLRRLRAAFLATCAFVAVLWWIRVVETVTGWNAAGLGVYPRRMAGLIGILTGPLIHGSFEHVFSNTLPLLILGTMVLYGYPRAARIAIPAIWLGDGLGVWLTARPAWHIGASGLVHGLMFFLFVIGLFRRDRRAIAFGMIAFFLYGGMVWSVFPQAPDISFEYHFWGAVMGVVCAVWLRDADPPPPRKRYSWEFEEEMDELAIGDLWQSRPPGSGDDQPPPAA